MKYKNFIIWIVFGVFALMFYLLNANTNIAIDDFGYKYIFTFDIEKNRVHNLIDILNSMHAHYLKQNGRLLVNGLAQLFLINDDKLIFNIVNTLMLIVVILLVYLLAGKGLKKMSISGVFFLILSFWFLIPGPNHSLLWLTGSINYLWAMALALTFLWVYKKLSRMDKTLSVYMYPLLFVFGFISGFTHEVISVGISGALFFIHIKKIKTIRPDLAWLISGFFLGTLILIIAPGNFVRLDNNSELTPGIMANLIHRAAIFFAVKYYLAFMILLFSMVYLRYKKPAYLKLFLKEQKIYLLSILISFVFIILAGAYQPRVFFGIAIFSILLLFKLFIDFKHSFNSKTILLVLGLLTMLMIVEWKNTYTDLKYNYTEFKAAEVNWRNKEQNVFPAIDKKKNRFVSFGMGGIDKDFWSNIVMSKYYQKDYLVFMPKHLYTSLSNQNSIKLDKIDVKEVKHKTKHLILEHTLYFELIEGYFCIPVKFNDVVFEKAKLIFKPDEVVKKSVFTLKEKIFHKIFKKKIPNIDQEKGVCYFVDIQNKEYIVFKKPVQISVKQISQIVLFDNKNNLIAEINL